MPAKEKIRIGILFGGRSREHEVSLTSTASVIRALDPEEFDITAIGLTKCGRLAGTEEVYGMIPGELHERIVAYDALHARDAKMRLCSSMPGERSCAPSPPEIIFPLLHGPYGEDGTIQGLLEITDLPYIGCGVLASAVGMDKDVMKRLFVQAGLPVLPFKAVCTRDLDAEMQALQRGLEREFGYPMFSKPANLGSSVGVAKIHSAAEFAEAVRFSAQFDRKILIEKGIDARELECAILGNDDPVASGVGEVIPAREFYDYQAKYDDPNSRLEIPAAVAPETGEEIRRISLAAFRAIDACGLARVDFLLERVSGVVWLNEINTMPGFTPISMYPKLWAERGVPFGELVRRLAALGLQRHGERSQRAISVGT